MSERTLPKIRKARKIVKAVLDHLGNRRGIGLDGIDDDVMDEIKADLAEIVLVQL